MQSKWLNLSLSLASAPLEIYSHALNQNKNIIHFTFGIESGVLQFPSAISDLPWVNSLTWLFGSPPAIDRDLLFINSTNNDLITFAKEIRPKLLVDDFSTYIFTEAGIYDTISDKLGFYARVLISFVGPTSGQSLILRLKHYGKEDGSLEIHQENMKLLKFYLIYLIHLIKY